MVRNTYGKAERLKSRKSIDQLFKEGQRFNMGVVRVFYNPAQQPGLRAGVGVSARLFKSAVDRNRIKRQLRECYRLQKHIISSVGNTTAGLDLFFIYTAKDFTDFRELYQCMERALLKIKENLR